jgi:hypothetical protein
MTFVVRFLRGRPELAGVPVNPPRRTLPVVIISDMGGEGRLTAEAYGWERTEAARLAHLVRALLTQLTGLRYGSMEITEVAEEFGPAYLVGGHHGARYVLRIRVSVR